MKQVPFKLDSESKTKLYFQLYQAFIEAFKSGKYAPEEKIPSVRQLSKDLSVSKNTVIAAYNMLLEEGYIISHQKSGYTVAAALPKEQPVIDTENEEDEIPTVDGIFKEREGTEVTKIPVPDDLELPKGTDETPETVTIEEKSVTKKPELTKETPKPAETQTDNKPVTPSVTIKPAAKPAPVTQDFFGERQLRKTIALFLYNHFNISCTSGQIYVAANIQDPLLKIMKLIAPAETTQAAQPSAQEVKGLFRKAEALLSKEETVIVYPKVAISQNSLNSFREIIKSAGYETIEIPETSDVLDIEQLFASDTDVSILSPEADNITLRDELLAWIDEKEERYIVEYYQNFPEEVPLCCENPNKVIFLTSIGGISFMILPSVIISSFRNKYADYENSASKELQEEAVKKINLLNEQIES